MAASAGNGLCALSDLPVRVSAGLCVRSDTEGLQLCIRPFSGEVALSAVLNSRLTCFSIGRVFIASEEVFSRSSWVCRGSPSVPPKLGGSLYLNEASLLMRSVVLSEILKYQLKYWQHFYYITQGGYISEVIVT